MKKNFAFSALCALCLGAITFTSCGDKTTPTPDPVKVTSVTLNETSKTLTIDETLTLTATVAPTNATDSSVTFSISGDAVEQTSSAGKTVTVKAIKVGTATVTVTANDGSGKNATCTITVEAAPPVPGDVAIAGDGFDIDQVQTIDLADAATAQVKVDVSASEGIDQLLISISSSNAMFNGALADMGMGGEFDLANPSGDLAALLNDLGLVNGAAVKDKTDVEFDISAFIPMIFIVAAGEDMTADFSLTVKDAGGANATKVLKMSFTHAPRPQLPNGDFEIATNDGTGTGKIGWYFYSDIADKFWDSGNGGTAPQMMVGKSVTTSVEGRNGGKAVEMKSTFLGMFGMGAFAAGNLYSGDFGETRVDLSNPSGTVHFGQPFTARPKSMSFWYKGSAGIIDYAKAGAPAAIGATDKYAVFIALVDGADYDPAANGADGGDHWHTVDTADLPGTAVDWATDSRVIGFGSFDNSTTVTDWTKQTIEITYRNERTPTHIVVVATASMYGDYFTGSTDSVLTVDDFELVY